MFQPLLFGSLLLVPLLITFLVFATVLSYL